MQFTQAGLAAINPKTQTAPQQASSSYSPLESAGMGAVNGLTLGAQNKLSGVAGMIGALAEKHPYIAKYLELNPAVAIALHQAKGMVGANGANESLGQAYTSTRDASANNFQQAQATNKKSYMAGRVAGTVAPAIAGAAPIDAGVEAGATGLKALLGMKAAAPEAEDAGDVIANLIRHVKSGVGAGTKSVAKVAANAGAQGAASGALSQDGGTAADKVRAAVQGGGAAVSALNPLNGKMGLADDIAAAAAPELGSRVPKILSTVAGTAGSVAGQNVGAGASQNNSQNAPNNDVDTDAILQRLGVDPNTPDGSQKAKVLSPQNLNESSDDNAPGQPVSSNVPNVITEPDGTKSLITATGQKVPLG